MILKESWVFSDRFININSDVVLLHLDLHVRQRMAATFRGTIHLNQFYLTLSLSAVHAKYTPGSQQCRSTLQIRTSCAGVLHCRSLPTFNFKMLYFSTTHPILGTCTSIQRQLNGARHGWFILRLKFDFDTELMECTCIVFWHNLFAIHSQ